MTRDELLKRAERCMDEITDYPTDDDQTHVIANGLAAIACVLLAKEMREGATVEYTSVKTTPEEGLTEERIAKAVQALKGAMGDA